MKKVRVSAEGTRIPPKMYSQAIVYNGIVYVSGQLGRHPEDGHLDLNDPEAQIRQSFRNVEMILEASGSSMENILELTCYLQNKEDLPVLIKSMQNCLKTWKYHPQDAASVWNRSWMAVCLKLPVTLI